MIPAMSPMYVRHLGQGMPPMIPAMSPMYVRHLGQGMPPMIPAVSLVWTTERPALIPQREFSVM